MPFEFWEMGGRTAGRQNADEDSIIIHHTPYIYIGFVWAGWRPRTKAEQSSRLIPILVRSKGLKMGAFRIGYVIGASCICEKCVLKKIGLQTEGNGGVFRG